MAQTMFIFKIYLKFIYLVKIFSCSELQAYPLQGEFLIVQEIILRF